MVIRGGEESGYLVVRVGFATAIFRFDENSHGLTEKWSRKDSIEVNGRANGSSYLFRNAVSRVFALDDTSRLHDRSVNQRRDWQLATSYPYIQAIR